MNQIPINEEKIQIYNKKAINIILLLVVLGIITGLILSGIFVNEANERIENIEEIMPFNPYTQPLTTSNIILPSLGVIIICISIYLLLGLIIIYIKSIARF